MKLFKSSFIVIILLLTVKSFAQENIFLNRDFWNTKPTPEIIDQKIKEGNNPAQSNNNNFDGVVYAILQDAPFKTIVHLLNKPGNDVNKLTHDGRTYIFWAAYKGNDKLMEYLLEKGAKTNIKDDHGFTILNFAANAGVTNTKVYDLCLKHGANLTQDLGHFKANALLLAIAKDKDLTITNYFVSKGLDINSTDKYGNGVFNYASKSGDINLLNKLLDKGLKGNDNAYLFAAYISRGKSNGIEIYKYLEGLGLNPNIEHPEEGYTPLHMVARGKNVEVINYFLNKGLSVNKTDKQGNTPFLNAVSRNNLEIIKLLQKNVQDINLSNKKGETALMLAVKSNTAEVVNFLVNKGANLNALDKKGNNLSYYLVESYSARNKKSFSEKLSKLKSLSYRLDKAQKNGKTWYHLAVEKNSIDLLKVATELNLDINAKDSNGNTALLLAAMKAKDDEILKYLLNHGANKLQTTDFEETAYDLAQENELLKQNNISIEFLK
ncbi:ankyrin repeat domain-containing protein [Seonamhaeicola sp. NFXS20]|uniref:ankyrin repeat domain-containing protein n=1 Tax=Seonamhaeicola sp. NFXS20 TaxID=2816959 RepID=UPI003B8E661D